MGWMVPGSNPSGGKDFLHPSRLALGPIQPPIKWVLGLSQGVKQPGNDVDHPPPHSTEVKERVELYPYSPSGASWPVLGWNYCNNGQNNVLLCLFHSLQCKILMMNSMFSIIFKTDNFHSNKGILFSITIIKLHGYTVHQTMLKSFITNWCT